MAGRPRRTTEELKWRQERIMEASARVFLRRGYDGATMEEIAREADYSTAALYNYFKNKQAIILAVKSCVMSQMFDVLKQPAPQSLPFSQRFLWLVQRWFEIAQQNKDIFKLLDPINTGHEPRIPDICDHHMSDCEPEVIEHFRRSFEELSRFVQQGMDSGELRSDLDAGYLASIISTLVRGAIIRWLSVDGATLEGQAERVVDLFVNGAKSR